MPSLLASIFIGICVVIFAWLVPNEELARPLWIFAFLALIACARFAWLHPKAPTSSSGWIKLTGLAIACGLFVIATDMAFFGISSGNVVLDLFLVAFALIVAVSGLIRSFVRTESKDA